MREWENYIRSQSQTLSLSRSRQNQTCLMSKWVAINVNCRFLSIRTYFAALFVQLRDNFLLIGPFFCASKVVSECVCVFCANWWHVCVILANDVYNIYGLKLVRIIYVRNIDSHRHTHIEYSHTNIIYRILRNKTREKVQTLCINFLLMFASLDA